MSAASVSLTVMLSFDTGSAMLYDNCNSVQSARLQQAGAGLQSAGLDFADKAFGSALASLKSNLLRAVIFFLSCFRPRLLMHCLVEGQDVLAEASIQHGLRKAGNRVIFLWVPKKAWRPAPICGVKRSLTYSDGCCH